METWKARKARRGGPACASLPAPGELIRRRLCALCGFLAPFWQAPQIGGPPEAGVAARAVAALPRPGGDSNRPFPCLPLPAADRGGGP